MKCTFALVALFGVIFVASENVFSSTTVEISSNLEDRKIIDLLNVSTSSPLVKLIDAIRFSMAPKAKIEIEESFNNSTATSMAPKVIVKIEESTNNSKAIPEKSSSHIPSARLELEPHLADILRKVFAEKKIFF